MSKSRTADLIRPQTPDQLHKWITQHFEATIATQAVIEGHAAPFDYLIHTFFEGQGGADLRDASGSQGGAGVPPAFQLPEPFIPDCIIWANRGGGKTFLGALATALDLLFKPGIQIRILAGSVEQGQRMHQHLRTFLEQPDFKPKLKGRITDRRITLKNKATVELLAQSQASVRGTRPQKLRCDEVELFDDEVWSAAQLTTRSARCGTIEVHGAIECLSTMHQPHGLMSRLIAEAAEGKRKLFKWGVIDTLERCGDEFQCEGTSSCSPSLREGAGGGLAALPPAHAARGALTAPCPLLPECRGRAKDKHPGHITISDALRMKSRVSLPVWNSEMLCNRPSRTHTVFPDFTPDLHVVSELPWLSCSPSLREGAGGWAPPCHGWPSSDTRAPAPSCHGWPSSDTRVPTPSRHPWPSSDTRAPAPSCHGWPSSDTRVPTPSRHPWPSSDTRVPAPSSNGWPSSDTPATASDNPLFLAGMDFGYRSPTVFLWAAALADTLYIIGEHYQTHQTLDAHIRAILSSPHAKPEWIGADPAGNARNDHSGISSHTMLKRAGLPVRSRASGIVEGLSLIAARLKPADGSPPRLFIHERCTNLIRALEEYHYDPQNPLSDEPVKDGPDHAVDALRYLVVNLDRPYAAESGGYLG